MRSSDNAMANLLLALDRCDHGRHKDDPCQSCDGGKSLGNRYLVPGTRIGTNVNGHAIVVPPDNRVIGLVSYWVPDARFESAAH